MARGGAPSTRRGSAVAVVRARRAVGVALAPPVAAAVLMAGVPVLDRAVLGVAMLGVAMRCVAMVTVPCAGIAGQALTRSAGCTARAVVAARLAAGRPAQVQSAVRMS